MIKELTARFLQMKDDAELARLSPELDVTFDILCGAERQGFCVQAGGLRLFDQRCDLSLTFEPHALANFLQTPPPPRFNAFTALQIVSGGLGVTGDALRLAQARPALERLFEGAVRAPAQVLPERPSHLRGVTGHYAPLGDGCELFYDAAGTPDAPAVVFLHTAGADARQFQAQMADCALQERFTLYAPDLPFHGRSLPPLSWSGAPYALNAERYARWVTLFLEEILGRPAILAGCSMGAALALQLCAARPDLVRGCVAIEPPFQAKGRLTPAQNHVGVHAGLHNSAWVGGLMSPLSPQNRRRRAAWIYAQAAPGVYQTDLRYYTQEFNGAQTAPQIDRALPIVLMSGAYDYSASPQDGAALKALLPQAEHLVMPQLGHFPMTEHPNLFTPLLETALQHILRAAPAKDLTNG